MLKLEEILRGEYTLRSVKEREGDLDYFVDNYGKPLIFRYKIEMEFFLVSTILLRVGQTEIYSLHFLADRDLQSSMSFVELDARKHHLKLTQGEGKNELVVVENPPLHQTHLL